MMIAAVKPSPMSLTHQKREYVVVSVGGSLVVPDAIDSAFLSRFRDCILRKVSEGFSFCIIVGGGKVARNYQQAAREVHGSLSQEDADWMGIHTTRLNAHLLRTIFSDHARERIVKNPTKRIDTKKPIIIGAGWRPGCSTDYDAVLMAKRIGAKKLVNLSNIDYVYSADPKKDPNAKKLEQIGWEEFRKIIPEKWDPGLSSPFDPIAAKEAQNYGLEVAIINGSKLEEFENYIAGKPFVGTTIG